ncbi:hypothetical protein VC83_03085 [Pseudogymnoascus destructans]|uniref:HTH CENPB-type domain-containing protein n=1 Tax=Pseudogymnoascus destructans TaxID=655981 RepID=A0A177AFF5_9PEZI|nr:uncharacterized protein VC83_03085 [Pseudogymnoascus destructans]OAF59981.1 hypothetical protein VC83_03085 [Pseudogymnoascus destructans]
MNMTDNEHNYNHNYAAIQRYIQRSYENGYGATKPMVFSAICQLRAAETPTRAPPSQRWFQTWIKTQQHNFHTIKTRPIEAARVASHEVSAIKEWFYEFKDVCNQLDITAGDIYNFDEVGFRVGMSTGEHVLVPSAVKELTEAELFQSELVQITTIMTEQRQRKVRSRKSIQKGGAITVEHARQRIYEKKVKEQLLEEAREKRERTRMVNVECKMQLRAGIDARKAERTRKKDLHEFQKSNPDTEPTIGLRTEIIDPDITQKKREEEEEAGRLLAIEESGYVNFAGLDYDMIHDASDGGFDDQSLPDNIDPNLF